MPSIIVKNRLFFVFVAFSIALVLVLRAYGFSSTLSQTIVFPFYVLVFLFFFPGSKMLRLVFTLPILFWIFSILHLRGYVFLPLSFSGVHIADLEGDSSNQVAAGIYKRFNEISRTYALGDIHYLHREFESLEEASGWLSKKKNVPFLLSGSRDRLEVVLRSDLGTYFGDSNSSEDYIYESLLSDKKGISYYTLPNFFPIAIETSELTLHFLSWLAAGLSEDGSSPEIRDDALTVASSYMGQWRSLVPLAMAKLALGTRLSIENMEEKALFHCAKKNFETAASYVSRENDAEAFASIFNNAGVNLLRYAETGDDLDLAAHLFWRAVGARDKNGKYAPSAVVALRNIELMHNYGLIR